MLTVNSGTRVVVDYWQSLSAFYSCLVSFEFRGLPDCNMNQCILFYIALHQKKA